LNITCVEASDFERDPYSKIRGEQQTTPGQQTVEDRRLLLTSDFDLQIEFLLFENLNGSVAPN